jgi:hypothetical protein
VDLEAARLRERACRHDLRDVGAVHHDSFLQRLHLPIEAAALGPFGGVEPHDARVAGIGDVEKVVFGIEEDVARGAVRGALNLAGGVAVDLSVGVIVAARLVRLVEVVLVERLVEGVEHPEHVRADVRDAAAERRVVQHVDVRAEAARRCFPEDRNIGREQRRPHEEVRAPIGVLVVLSVVVVAAGPGHASSSHRDGRGLVHEVTGGRIDDALPGRRVRADAGADVDRVVAVAHHPELAGSVAIELQIDRLGGGRQLVNLREGDGGRGTVAVTDLVSRRQLHASAARDVTERLVRTGCARRVIRALRRCGRRARRRDGVRRGAGGNAEQDEGNREGIRAEEVHHGRVGVSLALR